MSYEQTDKLATHVATIVFKILKNSFGKDQLKIFLRNLPLVERTLEEK
jgi:hypothetical protein